MVLYVNYPSWISPYVIKGLPIRWYAVMYLVCFAIAYLLYDYQVKRDLVFKKIDQDTKENIFLVVVIGLLVGARVGSCLFYDDTVYYLTHPWMIFWPFRNGQFIGLPGMSYHGGVIGGLIFFITYLKIKKLPVLAVMDVVCASIPLAYTFGRLGNFFNAELYGRVTSSPIGMVFPYAERFPTTIDWVRDLADQCGIEYVLGDYVNLPRWPSQLFEAFFEGIVLGLFLWFFMRRMKEKKGWAHGTISGAYFGGYGLVRFVIEYFRQPDADIGYVLSLGEKSTNIYVYQGLGNISKGQVFCFLMIVGSLAFIIAVNLLGKRKEKK